VFAGRYFFFFFFFFCVFFFLQQQIVGVAHLRLHDAIRVGRADARRRRRRAVRDQRYLRAVDAAWATLPTSPSPLITGR